MSNPNVTIDRQKYVGGSDLPSILGLNSKYGTSVFEFAKQKAGIIPNPFKGNQFTKYGQVMEPVIRDYINSKYQCNYLEDTIINEDKGYRGNTDGIDKNAEIPILEVKTFGEELDVEYYTPQCQFYMETFNCDAVRLVGYKRPTDFYTGMDYELENDDSYFNYEFDDNRLVEHIIKRDPVLWSKIDERITAFKKAVEKLKDNPNMTEEEFNTYFYGDDLVVLSNKVAILEKSLATYKDMEKEYKDLKEELYKVFEDKGLISVDFGTTKITKVSPTSYDTVGIDTKKLLEEEPNIYEKYKTVKTTNRKGYILITIKESDK
ncbi:MAG: YqaJ viral recombinase family protein [Clostridiales bacterium]|nr:YqaJ viral recombinase family protein [Clostridiales bacterium]